MLPCPHYHLQFGCSLLMVQSYHECFFYYQHICKMLYIIQFKLVLLNFCKIYQFRKLHFSLLITFIFTKFSNQRFKLQESRKLFSVVQQHIVIAGFFFDGLHAAVLLANLVLITTPTQPNATQFNINTKFELALIDSITLYTTASNTTNHVPNTKIKDTPLVWLYLEIKNFIFLCDFAI